ncbi:hypothetical protein QJS10_CPB15g00169 [Acorus calamus]|uniref:Uncharacterized protein n=1 Tax=Acorus calamus TaxID=4465 RepID=A0AAV9D8P9_ACOCL|nr:hypothetical protein QJS10_CPB15g00169 [Acorus calamus]
MAAGALSLAASAFASPKRTEREGSSSGPLPCLLRRPISSSSLSSLQFPSLYISTVELNNRPNRLSVHCTGSSSSSSPPPPPRKSSTTVSTKLYVSGLSLHT